MSTVMEKAKERPVISALLTIAMLVGAFTTIMSFVPVADSLVMTENEHDTHEHHAQRADIDRLDQKQTCRYLNGQITDLEDLCYALEKEGGNTMRLREKHRELKTLSRRYQINGCSGILYN